MTLNEIEMDQLCRPLNTIPCPGYYAYGMVQHHAQIEEKLTTIGILLIGRP